MLREHVKISDKAIADVAEAVFGCFLEHGGQALTYQIMEWLLGRNLKVESLNRETNQTLGKELHDERMIRTLADKINYEEVENILDYKFKDKALLVEALTHASYSANTGIEEFVPLYKILYKGR